MECFTIRLDNQGRIAIPARLLKKAELDIGTEVLAFYEDGGIVIITRDEALAQAQQMAQVALRSREGSVVGEFLD
jgi:bifunctional DNA-binding transcriptional regulator/antitoxin component of YhaV-PrlF toxin-antitoxin module